MKNIYVGSLRKKSFLRYTGYGILIIIDLLMVIYIVKFYYDKQEMDRWHRLRENAMMQFDKGALNSQLHNAQRELDLKRGEVVLQFSGPELLSYISEQAYFQKLAAMKLEQMTPSANASNALIFKMSATGSFAEIWKFLQGLESGKIPLKIQNVQLLQRNKGLYFSASISAKSKEIKENTQQRKTDSLPSNQEFDIKNP